MSKFKVGDKVRIVKDEASCGLRDDNPEYLIITNDVNHDGKTYYYTGYSKEGVQLGKCNYCIEDQHLDYYKGNKSIMTNLKEKFLAITRKEPQKSFVAKGITNTDDTLTEEGREIFEAWLLRKNATDFKKEVVDLIEEDK